MQRRLVKAGGCIRNTWPARRACTRRRMSALAACPLNIDIEVTRYMGWPGQAVAYKVGELKIRELRAAAKAALGDDFDIRAFHDAVLEEGAIPLDVLDTRIRAWIAGQQAEPPAAP